MGSIRINISTALVALLALVSVYKPHSVVAAEQNLGSTQSTVVASSSLRPLSSSTPVTPTSSHSTTRDEIYIDEEGLEGSGGRGEIHDDLEKEPEYSGSGFGPDDEDSSSATHHNKPTSHHTNNAGYKPTNRKIKPQKSHNIDEIETGSGDKPDNDDEDDGIDDDDDEDEEEHTGGGVINTNNEHNVDEDDFVTEIKQTDLTTTTDDENIELEKPRIGIDSETISEDNEIDLDPNQTSGGSATGKPSSNNNSPTGNEVLIMDKSDNRTASFFAQPGILAACIGGAVVGLLCAILVVMFIVYRMRKKDEGSYALDEPKRSPAVNSYAKNANNREFYA